MKNYYAHSGDEENNVLPQLYSTHINNVVDIAQKNIELLLKTANIDQSQKNLFYDIVILSAKYHDLGKLDETIQSKLSELNYSDERLLNHVDAGVAYLLKQYYITDNIAYLVSAFFVLCHHFGLQNWESYFKEESSQAKLFEPIDIKYKIQNIIRCKYNIKEKYNIEIDKTVEEYVDSLLPQYEEIHNAEVSPYICRSEYKIIKATAFDLRILFSCFIDADHLDTANHFSNKAYNNSANFSKLNPDARLDKLNKYIKHLSITKKTSINRTTIRKKLYDAVSNLNLSHGYYLLDATVGSGKTISAIYAALKLAKENNSNRIFSIAPFTNIIDQTTTVYRKSIYLKNLESAYNINEIHSKVEFTSPYLKKYNNMWNAPINITTAVQWVEGLVKNSTSDVRKLHLYANSIIILDEFHSFIPHEYWDFVLELFVELKEKYNTKFIFSSGSPAHYWEDIECIKNDLCKIVSDDLYKEMISLESDRIDIVKVPTLVTNITDFCKTVLVDMDLNKCNSCLIVVNTIRSSIKLTEEFNKLTNLYEIYHLSGYLTPKDRKRILEEVSSKLKKNIKIIVISTSIIECGVDVSFDIGYRQVCGLNSILQVGGRVNREHNNNLSKLYVFDFDKTLIATGDVSENPAFRISKQIFNTLKKEEMTAEYCTDVIKRERSAVGGLRAKQFIKAEKEKKFKFVGDEFNVIDSMTVTVIVDKDIISKINIGENISYRDIMNNSVQIWFSNITKPNYLLNIAQVPYKDKTHYIWTGLYDSQYGIGQVLLT